MSRQSYKQLQYSIFYKYVPEEYAGYLGDRVPHSQGNPKSFTRDIMFVLNFKECIGILQVDQVEGQRKQHVQKVINMQA